MLDACVEDGGVAKNEWSFSTHAVYLRAWSWLCGFETHADEPEVVLGSIASRIMAAPSFVSAGERRGDSSQVRESLANAWGSEFLLSLHRAYANEDELVGMTNNWGVILAYYTLYHLTQAVAASKGNPRTPSHPKTQNIFSDTWTKRPDMPSPWCLAYGPRGSRNGPDDILADSCPHVFTGCHDEDDAWRFAVRALRTTRERLVEDAVSKMRSRKATEKRKAWNGQESRRLSRGLAPRDVPSFRSRVTSIEKEEAAAKVRHVSLIDYLYRLRVKTNYETSRMFTEGPRDPELSRQARDDILNLTSATLLLHELYLAHYVGRARMLQLMDTWLKRNQAAVVSRLAIRRELVAAC